jgi:tape measure domain-containing protein
MSAPQLNVRVGLLFDEKSLANLERQMRSSGQRLSKIGTDLTLSLSLPLAAFGVSAIQAAGDIESLTLALKSQLGTADAAAKELDNLTKSALKPGIGLEQAVRGSVRLQGIGLSADEARHTIEQMGNAIASTGGSAQELDGVTKQFAQIISKGRLLQEDVSILSENMPAIAGLMQKAFGTSNVEAIRNMGVTGKEFVLQITKMAEGLPRVESGIKNGIGNAIDSLKQSAAKVGFAINEAFDVTGAIESVSSAVLALAQGFSALDPSIQKTILGFSGMLIAIGPLLKVKGALQLASGQLIGTYNYLTGAGSLLGGVTRTLTTAFIGLNSAAKAFVVIGLVTAVIALADSWGWFNEEATTAQKVQQSVNDAMKDAEASITAESGAAKQLISVLQDENTSREAKAAALKDLQKINPVYFGQLRIENGAVVGLTEAYGAYIANLVLAAKAKKAEGKLIEIDEKKIAAKKELIADQEKLNALEVQANRPKEGFQRDVGQLSGNASEAGAIAARITASKNLISQLELEEAEYDKIAKAGFEATVRAKGTITEDTKVRALNKDELKAQKDALKDLNQTKKDAAELEAEEVARGEAEIKMLREIQQAWVEEAAAIEATMAARAAAGNPIDTSSQAPGGEQGISLAPQPMATDLATGITAGTAALGAYSEMAIYAAEIQQQLNDKTFNFSTGLTEVIEKLLQSGDVIGAAALAMGDAIGKAASEGETSFKSLAQAAAGAAAKIVRAYIQQAVAAAVAKAIGSSIPFPFNLAAGAAAGGLASALFTKAIGAIGVKGFARGTNNAPGGMALVGEQGPELINLPRGSQVFPTPKTNAMLSGMGGGNMNVSGEFTVRGTDLVLVLERTQNKNERFR